MRRSVLVLCVLGFIFLIVGSGLAVSSVQSMFSRTITNSGTIRYPDGSPQRVSNPQQVSDSISLDFSGFAVVLASIGFFAVAFLLNRRRASALTIAL